MKTVGCEDITYAELESVEYAKLRRSLIRKSAKGADIQRKFLEAAQDTDEFLAYFKTVKVQEGDDLEPLADQMSEAEFVNPPSDTERRLFEGWRELTPRIACRTQFWARVTLRHIEEGRIESSFLAARDGGHMTGKQRIDLALGKSGQESTGLLDDCVRSVLRRFGGLPEARGNRSVYVNCPLARAWWRERLVEQVAEDEDSRWRIRRVVHPRSQQYWEELVTFIVSRNSVFGSIEVRKTLIRTLANALDGHPRSGLGTTKGLKRVCRSLSSIQASRELSVIPTEEVNAMVSELVRAVPTAS